MRSLRRFITRMGNALARQREDERMREEIEEHLALQTRENLRAGLLRGMTALPFLGWP
jgi:hypothetical protein